MRHIESLEGRSLFAVAVPTATPGAVTPSVTPTTVPVVDLRGLYRGGSVSLAGVKRGWELKVVSQVGNEIKGALTLRNSAGTVLGTVPFVGRVGPEGKVVGTARGGMKIEGRERLVTVSIEGRLNSTKKVVEGAYTLVVAPLPDKPNSGFGDKGTFRLEKLPPPTTPPTTSTVG